MEIDYEQFRELIRVATEHDENNQPYLDMINEWLNDREE